MKIVFQVLAKTTGICLILMLSACASLQKPVESQTQAPVFGNTQLDGSIRVDTENEEVAQLWSQAEQARKNNEDQKALDLLIQAIEISPENSLLWSRAAEIQLNNQQPALAESYAIKSNLYAGNNAPMQLRNWMMIEHARNLRGDLLGVRSAHKKVQQYQYQ